MQRAKRGAMSKRLFHQLYRAAFFCSFLLLCSCNALEPQVSWYETDVLAIDWQATNKQSLAAFKEAQKTDKLIAIVSDLHDCALRQISYAQYAYIFFWQFSLAQKKSFFSALQQYRAAKKANGAASIEQFVEDAHLPIISGFYPNQIMFEFFDTCGCDVFAFSNIGPRSLDYLRTAYIQRYQRDYFNSFRACVHNGPEANWLAFKSTDFAYLRLLEKIKNSYARYPDVILYLDDDADNLAHLARLAEPTNITVLPYLFHSATPFEGLASQIEAATQKQPLLRSKL